MEWKAWWDRGQDESQKQYVSWKKPGTETMYSIVPPGTGEMTETEIRSEAGKVWKHLLQRGTWDLWRGWQKALSSPPWGGMTVYICTNSPNRVVMIGEFILYKCNKVYQKERERARMMSNESKVWRAGFWMKEATASPLDEEETPDQDPCTCGSGSECSNQGRPWSRPSFTSSLCRCLRLQKSTGDCLILGWPWANWDIELTPNNMGVSLGTKREYLNLDNMKSNDIRLTPFLDIY